MLRKITRCHQVNVGVARMILTTLVRPPVDDTEDVVFLNGCSDGTRLENIRWKYDAYKHIEIADDRQFIITPYRLDELRS